MQAVPPDYCLALLFRAVVLARRGGTHGGSRLNETGAAERIGGSTVYSHGARAKRLAAAAGAGHGALSAGGWRGHDRAHRLCPAQREFRPAIRHRKSRRRRRHDRRGSGRQIRARRLHDPARCHCVFDQRLALWQPGLRLPQGFRSGLSGRAGAEHSRRHPRRYRRTRLPM